MLFLSIILYTHHLSAQCPSFTVNNADFCGTTSTTLTVSNNDATCPFNWYASPTGGKKIASGCSYDTPTLSCDQTYYVEDTATVVFSSITAGHSIGTSPLSGGGSVGSWDAAFFTTKFDTDYDMVINNITLKYKQRSFSCGGTYITIQLKDATTGVTTSYPLSPGCGNGTKIETIPVNFTVKKGTAHELRINGAKELVYYYANGGDFEKDGALDYAEGLRITGTNKGNNAYGAFFDWDITIQNPCPRQAITATQTCNVSEDCTNGIDDDCDGLIDCFDSECKTSTGVCADFYFGQETPACQIIPSVDPNFGLEEVWRSSETVQTRGTPVVGDLDGDNIPEVLSYNTEDVNKPYIYIFSGLDGSKEVEIPVDIYAMSQSPSIADTDGDGLGEIYVVDENRNLLCFENDGTPKSGFTITKIGSGTNIEEKAYHPAFADFNGDGIPEIYVANQVFNSITGVLLAEPLDQINSSKGGSGAKPTHVYPAAWDILPDDFCTDCSGAELICGDVVYSVNLTTGLLTEASKVPSYSNVSDGKVALADWDGDGLMDIVVTTACCGFGGSIYIWDPRKEEYLTQDAAGNPLINNPVDAQPSGKTNTGNPSIADFDGDGLLEIAYAAENEYIVMDNDLSIKWTKKVVDKSNQTTSTAFDFEGDGKTEIVYRDENVLYILDGVTGNTKAQTPCGSGTRTEQPIVVDVDGDGDAEIVCTCSDRNEGGQGEVRVFHSNTNEWVNTRRVWHQHNYAPVYVNDDLSIPKVFQNKALLAKQDLFFAQTPIVDIFGDPIFTGLPDIEATIDSVVFNDCTDSEGTAYISICNTDLNALVYDFDISLYRGNPKSGGSLLNTIAVKDENWEVLNSRCIQIPVTIPNANYELNVYINDDGSDPSNAPSKTFNECDLTNNIATSPINCNNVCTPPSEANIIQSDVEICDTDSTMLTANQETGYLYTWFRNDTAITNYIEKIDSLQLSNIKQGGAYKVRIADSLDPTTCFLESDIVNITIYSAPILSSNETNPTICSGDDGNIEISGLENGVEYSIEYKDFKNDNQSINLIASNNSVSIPNLSAGIYNSIRTSFNNCPSNIISDTLNDPNTATISVLSKSNPSACNGNDGNIEITGLENNQKYTIQFDSSNTTQNFEITTNNNGSFNLENLTANVYSNINATINRCQSNSLIDTLINPNAATISVLSKSNPSACNGNDGNIEITGLENNQKYTIQFDSSNTTQTFEITTDNNGSFNLENLTANGYDNRNAAIDG